MWRSVPSTGRSARCAAIRSGRCRAVRRASIAFYRSTLRALARAGQAAGHAILCPRAAVGRRHISPGQPITALRFASGAAMADFDTTHRRTTHEEETGPPQTTSPLQLPAVVTPTWTPDGPAPLLQPGSASPGLFTSAGVDDAPTPSLSAQEQRQRADEAALVAKGGHFSGDGAPSDGG